jgi:hypothetical protein
VTTILAIGYHVGDAIFLVYDSDFIFELMRENFERGLYEGEEYIYWQ